MEGDGEEVKDILVLLFILVMGVLSSGFACWVTMEPSHKEALGGKPLPVFKKILKWGLFRKL